MFLRYKCIAFLLLFVFIFSFALQAQVLDFTPARTRLLNQQKEVQAAGIISQYKYESLSSKVEILKFYSQMCGNQGFRVMKPQSTRKVARKNIFFFSKQKEGIIVTLVFLGPTSQTKGGITYLIIVNDFSQAVDKASVD